MEAITPTTPKPKRTSGVITLGLLVAALLVCWKFLIPTSVGEHVRRHLQERLAEHYPQFLITINHCQYTPSQGLIVSGLTIRKRNQPSNVLPIVHIEQLHIAADIELSHLSEGRPPIDTTRIHVRGATINVWPDTNGRYSIEPLWPLPKMGPGCPIMSGDQIRIRLCQSESILSPALDLAEIQFTLEQTIKDDAIVHQTFAATGVGSFLESFYISGERDEDKQLATRASFQRLHLGPSILNRLPESLAARLRAIQFLDARADVSVQYAGPLPGEKNLDSVVRSTDWIVKASVSEGRYADPRLPKSLENLQGIVVATSQGIQIHQGSLNIDQARCKIDGTLHGLQWPCPTQMNIAAENLQLEPALLAMLPGKASELQDRLHPSGIVDLNGSIVFDGTRWDLDQEIFCKGLSVNIDRFPYPLENIHGKVRYRHGITTADLLVATAGSAKLETRFQLSPPGSPVEQFIDISSPEPFLIDEALMTALTPRGESTSKLETFVRSLSPGGKIRLLSARLGRSEDDEPTKSIELEVLDGRLHYSGFPYPLYEVRGHILVNDNGVYLSQFQAQNNGGAGIQCEGSWQVAEGMSSGKLDLTFKGYNLPLDEGLRTALPETAQQTWDTLNPSGSLELLQVNIQHGPEPGPPELNITAQQWSDANTHKRVVSVTPTSLPYRLDIHRGTVRMTGDTILISDVDGYHGQSRLSAEGRCLRRNDGRWQLDLNLLTGSRLRPDAELISALPEDIRGGFSKLQLREPVSLRGTTQLILPDLQHPLPVFSWDVLLQLEGNRIGEAGPVHDLRGEIFVRGTASGGDASADGRVNIDSMHIHNLQVTEIRGPFTIRGNQLRLGAASFANNATASNANVNNANNVASVISGRLLGGQVTLQGNVLLSSGNFDVDFNVIQANVAALLSELSQAQAGLKGSISGTAHLEGNLGTESLLRGSGSASLTESNLYQLPLLVQVLSQLRLVPGEDAAFTDGTTDFTIDGDLLTLSDLQLWGDIVALQGGGTIAGKREMDLVFNTRVSPQNTWSKLVRPLSSQKYTLWTIYVTGSIGTPQIERRALDAVGETLERLFPVMDRKESPINQATLPPPPLRNVPQRPSDLRPTPIPLRQ